MWRTSILRAFIFLVVASFLIPQLAVGQSQLQIPADKLQYYIDTLKYGTEEELQKALSELLIYDCTPLLKEMLTLLSSNAKPVIKISVLNCLRQLKKEKDVIKPVIEPLLMDKFTDKTLLSALIVTVGELEITAFEDRLYAIFTDEAYKDDISLRRTALSALGKTHSSKFMEQIYQFLTDTKNQDELRSYAALYFSEFASVDPKYIAKFNQMVVDKAENSYVRRYLLYALSKYKDPSSYDSIIKALTDDDPYIQIYAARALKNYDAEKAISLLLDALRSNNQSVRIEIINLLAEIKSMVAIEAIIYKARYDKDAGVRKAARIAFLTILEANKTYQFSQELAKAVQDMLTYLSKYDPDESNRKKAEALLKDIFNITPSK